MIHNDTYFTPKKPLLFSCLICNFISCNKKDYIRHIATLKHKKYENDINDTQKNPKKTPDEFACHCGKIYSHKSNLYRHRKKCTENNCNKIINIENKDNVKELIIKLMTDNADMKNENKYLLDTLKNQQQQISDLIPKIGDTINNIKQKFNIQIFLNEKCKNALSIDEFIDKIEISMKNLLTTKDQGLGVGLSNIIIDNMNKLSLYERPMHCTDKKRETLYIKNDEWGKDKDNQQITDLLKKVENKQIKGIKKWTDEHPNFLEDEKLQEEYMNLIRGCTSSIEACKEKAIKKVCENVYITD
jgi:hypothetical protein